MAQSAGEQLEDIRDEVAAIHKEIDTLKGRLAGIEKAGEKPAGADDSLRAEFNQLKAQLAARFGHSLE